MAGRLRGKVAIVTGAGTGIGEAIAHKLAKEGASVVVGGLASDPIEAVARSITGWGGRAAAFAGDVLEHTREGNENKETETIK